MEKISLQLLLSPLKLSSIPGIILKGLGPQSEIEDLMSSTLHELSESKGRATLGRVTF